MSLQLFAHPFSSYCQKALIAFFENDIPYTLRLLSPEDPDTGAEFAKPTPLRNRSVNVETCGRECPRQTGEIDMCRQIGSSRIVEDRGIAVATDGLQTVADTGIAMAVIDDETSTARAAKTISDILCRRRCRR